MPCSTRSRDSAFALALAVCLGGALSASAQPAPPPPPPEAPSQLPPSKPAPPADTPPPATPPPEPAPKPPADAPVLSPEERARAEFEKGQRQYDLGRFDRAIDHYARAYEALPLPAFLFNIAQSHRQLTRYKEAAFFYRRYLDLAQNPQNAPLARQLLAEVEAAQGIMPSAADGSRSAEPPPPLYKRRWVWFTLAGVVAASATVATMSAMRPERPTLGTVDGR